MKAEGAVGGRVRGRGPGGEVRSAPLPTGGLAPVAPVPAGARREGRGLSLGWLPCCLPGPDTPTPLSKVQPPVTPHDDGQPWG